MKRIDSGAETEGPSEEVKAVMVEIVNLATEVGSLAAKLDMPGSDELSEIKKIRAVLVRMRKAFQKCEEYYEYRQAEARRWRKVRLRHGLA